MSKPKKIVFELVNKALKPVKLELTKPKSDFQEYIPFDETLAGAKKAGLSVGDYIDLRYNVPGSTQDTIDKLVDLGVFQGKVTSVCEIGPGSGRYLEKTIQICHPEYYEIYETAKKWQDWLVSEYGVVAQPCDQRTLATTASNSIDLVHTHKVLNGLGILNICSYLLEMIRVVKDNGVVVFDVLTEECLDDPTLERWLSTGADYITSMTAKQFTIEFFQKRGFHLVGNFFATSEPGITHYFVFKGQA